MKRQQTLPIEGFKTKLEHGGVLNRGKRKTARPVVTKKPMHIVFRARFSVLRSKRSLSIVKAELSRWSKQFYVKIYHYSIVGNHIHAMIRAKTRQGFKYFMRVLTGQIAQRITRATKGRKLRGAFWAYLAYSRVVAWGKDFLGVKKYIIQNELEAMGVIPYQDRPLRARTSLRSGSS